jgi:UPF0716 protein FxsA
MQVVLILLFLALPLLELAVMIKVGAAIGALATIGLLILSGVVGAFVIQSQGLTTIRRTLEELQRGEPPIEPMMDGALLCFAGGLFVVPGFITDVIAVFLLIPPLRRAVAQWALGHAVVVARTTGAPPSREPDGTNQPGPRRYEDGPVIEGEFKRLDQPSDRDRPNRRDPS